MAAYHPYFHPHSGGIITPTKAAPQDRTDNIIKVRDWQSPRATGALLLANAIGFRLRVG